MNMALKGKELLSTNSRFRIKKTETRCRRKRNTRVYQAILDNLLIYYLTKKKKICAHYIFILGELPATERPTLYIYIYLYLSLQNMYWSKTRSLQSEQRQNKKAEVNDS